ncbi:PIN-like domain-containing protein [Nocardiopsis dassonvillei]|uniref:PIN-like domain-containing protein n=1 Tax=Nocardiopsis dassonvillei TaxID=2014 RepID=UPI0012FDDDF3|nr:PIN-like domain-containing protein [Nocardiopsis dassonvillei]
MGNFKSDFLEYYSPSDSQIEDFFKRGMICPDANVLLDAYRFNTKTRSELLKVLKALGPQLWIPHQVALEFHKNRINAIAGFEKKYSEAHSSLSKLENYYTSEVAPTLRELSKTIALPEKEKDYLISKITSSIKLVEAKIKEHQSGHGISLDSWRSDPVLESLLRIIAGKVGEGFDHEEREEALKEAGHRIENRIPPGYKDSEKSDPHGDYFIWRQMLTEAKRRNASLLFVTRDEKEDWFRIEKGKTISARPELIREALDAGVECAILNTKSFLYHANKVLGLTVSHDLINKMGQTPERPRRKQQKFSTGKRVDSAISELNETERRIEIFSRELSSLRSQEEMNHPPLPNDENNLASNMQRTFALKERIEELEKRRYSLLRHLGSFEAISRFDNKAKHPPKEDMDTASEARNRDQQIHWEIDLEKNFKREY